VSAHNWFDDDVCCDDDDFDVENGFVGIGQNDACTLFLSCEDIIYIAKQLGMTKERFE